MLFRYGLAVLLVNAVLLGAAWAEPMRLLVLGDSLAAGYGLPAGTGFPETLERRLREKGYQVEVINAGVSGDTSAGGLARLDWVLGAGESPRRMAGAAAADGGDVGPDAAIVELGANDALRGLDPDHTFANLDAIVARLRQEGVAVLLAGMLAPPNLGPEYGQAFEAVYPRLAEKHGVLLYPFFLDGVAANPALNQGDGMHPNAKGVAVIVERILPHVELLLERAR